MWPTWGPPGADMTQVGPMLAACNLLSGTFMNWTVNCFIPNTLFSGTTVVAEGYMGPYSVIDRTDSQYTSTGSALRDRNGGTCMTTKRADMTLQAVFSFPDAAINRQMSVEVMLKSITDCASPAWTWFVESECSINHYLECSRRTLRISNDQTSYCEITCDCFLTCDYLYLKHNRIRSVKDESDEICEVRVIYGDIEPNTQQ